MGTRLRALGIAVALLVALRVDAALPEEVRHPLEMARNLVDAGDWSSAIEAYVDHLSHLTTRDYRDKKTLEWILEAYEKHAGESPDYEAIKTIAKEKLPAAKAKPDPILSWRIHELLARIAQRENDAKEHEAQLGRAIATYPEVRYSMPEQQSRLQHLYNELALLKATSNVETGENYLVDAFLKDARFEFVYLPPWKDFYTAAGTPERYAALRQRVIDAYAEKAKDTPAKADAFTHYRRLLEAESPDELPKKP